MRNCFPFALAMSLISISPASAQQFGLKMGETLSQVKSKGIKIEKKADNVWSAPYLPYGNKMFDDYRMFITPKAGLCKVTAYISEIPDSKYGDRTKDKYESIRDSLNKRYGEGREYNFLRSGATWKNSDEWMWSMYKEERILSAFWDVSPNKVGKSNLNSIQLKVTGLSTETTMISLSYEFTNMDSCVSEDKKSDSNNL